MNYFKYLLLVTGLVFAGASCGLKAPVPVETSKNDAEIERLKSESDRLKDEVSNLKDEMKEKEDAMEKENEKMDDEKLDNEMPEDPDDFKFNEKAGGVQRIQDLAVKPDEDRVVILLTADLEDYKGEDRYAAFGCKDVLVPVAVDLEKEMSDLAHAIVELITTKKDAYEDQGLSNSVSGIGLTLENVHYEDGTRIVDLAGDKIGLTGICSDARIIFQLEETIKIYDKDFEIRLNGSASEWKDLFELLG